MSGASAEDFARASDAIEALLAAVRPDQWDAATPCEEWNLRQLADHLVEVNYSLAGRFGGLSSGTAADPVTAYRLSAQALRDALALPGVLDQTYPGPFAHTTGANQLQVRMADLLTHGWIWRGPPALPPTCRWISPKTRSASCRNLPGHSRDRESSVPRSPSPRMPRRSTGWLR
ncbi:TIGR03086 family protein [Mycobacteroides abscessus]|nr:TIGR03086 family protein [Mycobacteroides abscessus]